MKKNIYKILATAFAVALIAASPITSITSHALGFNPGAHDDTDYGKRPDFDFENTPAPSTPAPSTPAPDSGSGNSGSGNNGGGNTERSETSGNGWSKADPNNVVVSVTGGQAFRSVMNKEHTVYEVYHKGISVATFTVTDDKGNEVTFSTVTLEKGEDGLWYLNITLPEGVDVKGLTVALTKGDLAYLASELGVSGIQLNGTVMLLTTTEEEETTVADTDKSDKKETETSKTGSESTAVGARVCWCGERIDIANKGGLSAEEKAAWKAHAAAHLAKGESTSYTDVAY